LKERRVTGQSRGTSFFIWCFGIIVPLCIRETQMMADPCETEKPRPGPLTADISDTEATRQFRYGGVSRPEGSGSLNQKGIGGCPGLQPPFSSVGINMGGEKGTTFFSEKRNVPVYWADTGKAQQFSTGGGIWKGGARAWKGGCPRD